MRVAIRDAAAGDETVIVEFIMKLAQYERLAQEAIATTADINRALFGPSPKVFCQLAEIEGKPAGFALWYYTFSTFQGRHGIWLEDLYVNSDSRGLGVGKALLAELAQRCIREGLGRYEWNVLDWNRPSIDFYVSQGAVFLDDWRRCRVSGEALAKLGATA